jgi:hypothetical protein
MIGAITSAATCDTRRGHAMADYQQQAMKAVRDIKAAMLFKGDNAPADNLARELYAVERLAQAIDRNTAALRDLKREPWDTDG